MTPLTKRVQRRCIKTKDAGKRLVIAFDTGDTEEIAIRRERSRKWFRVPVLDIYHLAVKRELGLTRGARRKKTPRA